MGVELGVSHGAARQLADRLIARGRARKAPHTPHTLELIKEGRA
jgi:hypothetical protein